MQRGLENAGVSLETYVGAGMPHVFPVFASFIYGTNTALLRKAARAEASGRTSPASPASPAGAPPRRPQPPRPPGIERPASSATPPPPPVEALDRIQAPLPELRRTETPKPCVSL